MNQGEREEEKEHRKWREATTTKKCEYLTPANKWTLMDTKVHVFFFNLSLQPCEEEISFTFLFISIDSLLLVEAVKIR